MDIQSQTRFDELVRIDPLNWSEDDKAFLRARRPYMNSDQLASFASVLELSKTEAASEGSAEEESAATEAPAPSKKSRK